MAQDIIKEITKRNKSYFTIKEKEQLIKDTKITIISLAYTDDLTRDDLLELSVILEDIADFKSSTTKKKGIQING